MSALSAAPSGCFTVAGPIQQVDLSSRELTLLVGERPTHLIVSPGCAVHLNGERVKLRMLQPGDQAEVAFTFVDRMALAHTIHVHWQPRVIGTFEQQTITDVPRRNSHDR